MNDSGQSKTLLQRYESTPVIRALIQLVPFGAGSAIDTFLMSRLEQLREMRSRIFYDELATGKIPLTKEVVDSDAFLHAYFATVKAALSSHRAEKIKLFARLLKSSAMTIDEEGADKYEEFLQILDSLSIRELSLLALIDRFEAQALERVRCRGSTVLFEIAEGWPALRECACSQLDIDEREFGALVTRLPRSGLVEIFRRAVSENERRLVGSFYEGAWSEYGRLTPMYAHLKKMVGTIEDL